MINKRALIPIFAALLLLVAIFSVPVASQTSLADNVLFYLPCHAWTEIHSDRDSQIVVEKRTVEFIRQYAVQSVQVLKKQAPEKNWQKNADGADVDDRQIVNWVTGSCAKNPDKPLAFVALLMAAAFMLVPNHAQLPPP
jgi:hypothetical protein